MTYYKKRFKANLLWVAIAAAGLFWVIESAIDSVIFHQGTFYQRLIAPDPNEIWMRIVIAILLIGFGGYAQRAFDLEEEDLAESEASKRSIINTAFDAFIQSDSSGLIIDWNREAEVLFGWSKDEVVGHPLTETIIPPRFHAAHLEGMAHFLATGKGRILDKRIEVIATHRSGHEFPVEITHWAIKTKEEYLFNAFIRDITERKNVEKSQRLAATVFETASEAIIVTDKDNKILSVNPAFTHITGYSEKDVIGKNPRILKSDRHNKRFYDEMWDTIRTTGHWEGEILDKRKNGEIYPKWLSVTSVKDKEGNVIQYTGLFTDISKIKQDKVKLRFQASHDALTGLPNRSLAFERLSQATKQVRRNKEKAALLLVDLDRFKKVNDTFGHAGGDKILQQVGTRLRSCVRETDTVARIGGDEFLIVLLNISRQNSADLVAEKIVEETSHPFMLEGREIYLGASIGITIIPDDGNEGLALIKNADMAMYKAKTRGGSRYRFFSEEMEKVGKERNLMELGIRQALKNREFVLYFQPIVDLKSRETITLEALVRWNHPTKGFLPPDQFISIAEDSNLITQLGEWILNSACMQAKKWRDHFGFRGSINVNVSTRQIIYNDFRTVLVNALNKSGLPPEYLTLEITESLMLDPAEDPISKLRDLKDVGVKIAIDDFGTGYSSLSYLWRYPIDYLKIDRSFISNITSDKKKQDIVEAMVRMGQSMKMTVVAEGVETPEELSFLVDLGCDTAQGYFFSKPLSVKDYEAVLQKSNL